MKSFYNFVTVLFLVIIFLGCNNKTIYWLKYNKSHFLEKEKIANIIERDKILQKGLRYSRDDFWDKYTDISRMYLKIGDVYSMFGAYSRAIIFYKKYKNSLTKNDVFQYIIDERIVDSYIKLGLYDKAINYINDKNIYDIEILNWLVEIYKEKREFKKAIFYVKKFLKLKNYYSYFKFVSICNAHNQLGDLYISTKNYQKAIKHLSYSLKVAQSQLLNKNSEYNVMKREYYSQGNSETSRNFHLSYPTSFDARTKEEYNLASSKYPYPYREISLGYFYLGKVYYELGDYQKAYLNFKNSYKYKTDAFYHKIFLNQIYRYFAFIVLNYNKNYNKFFSLYIDYIIKEKEIYGNNHINIINAYQELANIILREKKDYKKSFEYNQMALNILNYNIENNFLIFNSYEKERNSKFTKKYINNFLYSAFLYKINTQKYINDSILNIWINYKGSIFYSENRIFTLYQNTKDQALKEQIETLMLNQRILANLYQNIEKDETMRQRRNKIEAQEEKISELTTEIAQKASIFQEQQGLKSIDFKAITKNLKPNELYIDYAKAGDYYYIFTLNKKEEIGFIEIDENSTKKIDDLIMSFREDIETLDREQQFIKSSKEKLTELYNLLIKNPLKDKLDNKTTLIISPDGALRFLPFETLYDKEREQYLVENREIRYIPSGKELVRLYRYAKDKVSKTDEVIVFANPNFQSSENALYHEQLALTRGTNQNIVKDFFTTQYKELNATKIEAEEIDKIMPNTKLFMRDRANETNLLRVKEPKILHIATHGFFINAPNVPNPMLKSGIILSGANYFAKRLKGYGRVTALKLSGLDLKGTDLVVLSACETGLVDINNTDSISGLGKAFIQAGAKDVVMSLWSVDDNATKNLMVSFYKQIKAKENKKEKPNYAKALKEAKLKMIVEDRHPFYWGGFIVLGL